MTKKTTQIIHPKVSLDNYKALKHVQQTRHISLGDVVDAALKKYFDPVSEDEDTALLIRRLDRLSKQQTILETNMKIIAEMMALYIQVFLTNTEEVPNDQLHAAIAKGNRRYSGFIDKVSKNLAQSEGKLREVLEAIFLEQSADSSLQAAESEGGV